MSARNSIRKPWSLEEDTVLLQLIDKYGATGCWPKITLSMEARTGKQCRERYINHLDPDMKKTAWTVAENNIIRDNFPEFGTKWSQYMVALPGRSDNAIKNRYHVISRNNFDSAHTSDAPIISVLVAQKRLHSETSSDDSETNSNEEESAEDQNRKRLKKLLAARIVLELEILELERQCALDDDGSLSTNPTTPSTSEIFVESAEEPMGELDSDFDFDFEWTDADTLLATEHASILEVKYRCEADKLAGKKVPSVIVIQI